LGPAQNTVHRCFQPGQIASNQLSQILTIAVMAEVAKSAYMGIFLWTRVCNRMQGCVTKGPY